MWSLLWSKPALYVYACIALICAYGYWHHHVYQQGWDDRATADAAAQVKFDAKVTNAGITAVTGVLNANAKAAPALDLVAAHILRDCGSGVQSAATTSVPDAAARKAKDAFAQSLSDDLRTCSNELNRFAGLQEWAKTVSE